MNTDDLENETNALDEIGIHAGMGIQEIGVRIGITISKEIAKGIFNKLTKPIVTVNAFNENKEPVKDVIVILGNKQEVTSASGRAIFENMKPGKYTVYVKYRDKEEPNMDVIFLENGERATLSITLRKDQFFQDQASKIKQVNVSKVIDTKSTQTPAIIQPPTVQTIVSDSQDVVSISEGGFLEQETFLRNAKDNLRPVYAKWFNVWYAKGMVIVWSRTGFSLRLQLNGQYRYPFSIDSRGIWLVTNSEGKDIPDEAYKAYLKAITILPEAKSILESGKQVLNQDTLTADTLTVILSASTELAEYLIREIEKTNFNETEIDEFSQSKNKLTQEIFLSKKSRSDLTPVYKKWLDLWSDKGMVVYWGMAGFTLRIEVKGKLQTLLAFEGATGISLVRESDAMKLGIPENAYRIYLKAITVLPELANVLESGKQYIKHDVIKSNTLDVLFSATTKLAGNLINGTNNPDDREIQEVLVNKKDGKRIIISEQEFYKQLETSTSPKLAQDLLQFMGRLSEIGVVPSYGSSSLNLRWFPESTKKMNFGSIRKIGTVDTDPANWVPGQLGKAEIGEKYQLALAEIVNGNVLKAKNGSGYTIRVVRKDGAVVPLADLLNRKDQWFDLIVRTQNELAKAVCE